ELAPAEMGISVGPVAVERDDGLVFENSLLVAVLGAQDLALGKTRDRAARRGGESTLDQLFRARYIGVRRVGHKIKGTGGKFDRQPALRCDGPRIERQGALEQQNLLRPALARRRPQSPGAPAQNVVARVRTLDWLGGGGLHQFEVERDSDPIRDFVLQG